MLFLQLMQAWVDALIHIYSCVLFRMHFPCVTAKRDSIKYYQVNKDSIYSECYSLKLNFVSSRQYVIL